MSQVNVQQVLAARTALMRAGANLWQPLDVSRNAIGDAIGGGDDEVNRALEQLLMGGNRNQVGGQEATLVSRRGRESDFIMVLSNSKHHKVLTGLEQLIMGGNLNQVAAGG